MHMRVYVTDSTLSVSVVPDFHVSLLVFNFTDITAVFVNIMSGEKKEYILFKMVSVQENTTKARERKFPALSVTNRLYSEPATISQRNNLVVVCENFQLLLT